MNNFDNKKYENFKKMLEIYLYFLAAFYIPKDMNKSNYKHVNQEEYFEKFINKFTEYNKLSLHSISQTMIIFKNLRKLERIKKNIMIKQKVVNNIKERLESLLLQYEFKYFIEYFEMDIDKFSFQKDIDIVTIIYESNCIYCGIDNLSKNNFIDEKIELFCIELKTYNYFTDIFIEPEFNKIFKK